MSVPDEPAHTIKAASVVRGELQGTPGTAQGEPTRVSVPAFAAEAHSLAACFVWKPTTSAGCSPRPSADTTMVTAYTSAGNYNPMYYAVAGLPSLFLSGSKAIYSMRIVSGLFSAVFIAMSLTCLASLRRWRLPLFVGSFALTPMVLFLSGAINPNSLEIAASMAIFGALCLAWERIPANGRWRLPLAIAAVSAAVLANTRAASMIWLALAVIASFMMFGLRPFLSVVRQKFVLAMAGIVAVGCALALLWLKSADSLQNLLGEGIDAPPIQIVSIMLDRTFDFAAGYVSYLGWLDTLGPNGVLAVWAALIIGALAAALTVPSRSARLTVLFLAAVLLVLPPVLQIPLAKDVGLIWQGRYILALVAILIAACGVALRSYNVDFREAGRRASLVLLGLLVFGHLYSYVYGMRRYVIGLLDISNWSDMVTAPQWQPPFGWITLSIAYLLVLVTAAVLLHKTVTRADPENTPDDAGRHSVADETV
ncbi:DUF2142 domain-containing protein [Arthrobacter sp. CJ23]|uniref:DUF2142 domain-containing protein n=1 Tax=Arthrobacter sp. CJ23 TaxID=2972479 RepID=UPI00215CF1FE|nr:DUF2142 domain-containing protein [Arthrobacter sp. CJ23]UVJ41629.1 DUF2142 domain-containing protein [Arthrobacter sp. CJ23]